MLGLFGKRKATQVLGLDISSTTVKLLELSFTGGRYRVESYAVSSLPQDAVIEKSVNDVEGVSNAIRTVVAQSRTKLKNVAAAVAGGFEVSWLHVAVLAAGSILGGIAVVRLSRRLPAVAVRRVVAVIAFALAGYYFLREWTG